MTKFILSMLLVLAPLCARAACTQATSGLGLCYPNFGDRGDVWAASIRSNFVILNSSIPVATSTPTYTSLRLTGWLNAGSSVTANAGFYGDGTTLTGVATSAQLTSTAAALSSEITRATARENAIAVSTGVLQADLATEVSRATLRENDISVSTGVIAASDALKLPLAGGTLTGQLTINNNSTMTVTGNAFSVGGSSLSVNAGNVSVGGPYGLNVMRNTGWTSIAGPTPRAVLHVQNYDIYPQNPSVNANLLYLTDYATSNGMTIEVQDNSSASIFFASTSSVRSSEIINVHNGGFTIGTRRTNGYVNILSGNGTEAMRVASDGRVGMGLTVPSQKLHVSGNASFNNNAGGGSGGGTRLDIVPGAANTTVALKADANDGAYPPMTLFTGGSERFRIAADGKVGVGSDPSTQLDVKGVNTSLVNGDNGILRIYSSDSAAIDKGGSLAFGGSYTGTNPTTWAGIAGNRAADTDGYYGGYLQFITREHGVGFGERMRITEGGHVGINTTTPALSANAAVRELTVTGPAGVTSVGELNLQGRRAEDGSRYGSISGWHDSLNTTRIDFARGAATNSGIIQFHTDNAGAGLTQKMTLTAAGRLGIGNVAPTQALDVTGNIATSGQVISSGTGNNYLQGTTNINAPDTGKGIYTYGNLNIFSTDVSAAEKGATLALGGATGQAISPFPFAKLRGEAEVTGSYNGALTFITNSGGSMVEKARITSGGNVLMGADNFKSTFTYATGALALTGAFQTRGDATFYGGNTTNSRIDIAASGSTESRLVTDAAASANNSIIFRNGGSDQIRVVDEANTNDFKISVSTGTGATALTERIRFVKAGGTVLSDNLTLKTYAETKSSAAVSTTYDVSWSSGSVYWLSLNDDTTLTFSSAVEGQSLTFFIKQNVGSKAITWPTISWPSATAPTLTTTAGKLDIVTVVYTGGVYYGFLGGQNY